MLAKLRRRMDEHSENFNKGIYEITNQKSQLMNTITELKKCNRSFQKQNMKQKMKQKKESAISKGSGTHTIRVAK